MKGAIKMRHPVRPALAAFLLLPLCAAFGDGQVGDVVVGEKIDPSLFGTGVVESMEVVLRREEQIATGMQRDPKGRNGAQGEWVIPSRFAVFHPRSGERYAMNKWGDTRLGIGFPKTVDVDGAYFSGQGNHGAWASAVRAHGYRDGKLVKTTTWFTGLGEAPKWFAMQLREVDRIEIEARPVVGGAGWYSLDDLQYTPRTTDGGAAEAVVIDFEDTQYGQTLTGSGYAGLTWEMGTGDFTEIEIVHPPQVPDAVEEPVAEDGGAGGLRGGLGTTPTLEDSFETVRFGAASGANSIPPDTCGAIGPNHFVTAVNRNLSVYNKAAPHTRVLNVSFSSFLPGSSGDPRILFDQHSGRWIVLITDFSTRIFLAVSTTNDPTGTWFKTNFTVSTGVDASRWPDFPTLGVDANGIYTSAYMVSAGMSVFVIEKAPLIAPVPSLGTVTAFRSLAFEWAIQPVHTYGDSGGQFYISTPSSPTVRVRKVTGPITSPTLTTVANINVGSYSSPPDAPALGSSVNINTGDFRFWHTPVYRDGFIWTTHAVSSGGRSAARWYKLSTAPFAVSQSGTVTDPSLYYFYPHLAVSAIGDVVMGMSGSQATQYVGTYYTGRRHTDAAGEMAVPVLYKAGNAAYTILDGSGRNRWGDYSATTLDPNNESTMWTMQEFAFASNTWSTYVAVLSYGDCNNNGIIDTEEILGNPALDCQDDGQLDECQLVGNDCNANLTPDECDLADNDCNSDFIPDDCQLGVNDCDANLIPDDCDAITLAATINQPADQAPCNGGEAVFGAAAPGATGYQWFRNGSEALSDGGNLAGANSATLTVDPASAADQGSYHCVVSFGCIDVNSQAATLDLATDDLQVTLISPSPIQTCASAGATIAAFEVSVNDSTAVTFQWSLNGNDLVNGGHITGANGPRVEINPATGADVGFYTCTVSNACDVDTPTAVGELRIASSFAQQPAPTVCVEYGSNAVFTAEAGTNPAPDFYRWYEGATLLNDGGRISGAWTDTMTLTNVQAADHGRTFQLRLIVGSPFCSNYSQPTQLMALPVGGCPDCPNPGDMDGDGDFDLADAQLFSQCFDADVLTRSECGCANVHPADTFVNLLDWEALEALLTGPN